MSVTVYRVAAKLPARVFQSDNLCRSDPKRIISPGLPQLYNNNLYFDHRIQLNL